ncbi:MAG TPA: exopolysaccharide biosynthesis protein [Actinophytocola sp.]|uniref:exopolysaccharide biosynthesis protein n=1 Tax=Actinophytocola sp. TaxID=1872138 RepID=UPI002DBA5EFC|nr:exopolysaccharide biosynthesis protein [Actinophytocola sp.]HEU5469752.1 exopolysaccharide biosynthesis protein [Actinophytocola sp.]
MTDDTVRLSTIGQIVRGRWRLLAVIAIVGALAGAGASFVLSPGYRTSTSILLQGPRTPDELVTETQIAVSTVVLDRAARTLGGVTAADLRDAVSAEVVDGNVIDIVATDPTPERAVEIADRVAQEYVAYYLQLAVSTDGASTQVQQEKREQLRQDVEQTNNKITELHGTLRQGGSGDTVKLQTELESLRGTLNEAVKALDGVGAGASRGGVVVMGSANRPTSPAAPTLVQLSVGGAVAFLLVGLFGYLVAGRADRRLRGENEIAAALGAPALGHLDVPEDGTDDGSGPAPLRWLTHHGRPLDLPRLPASAEDDLDLRDRRVLARVRETTGPGSRLLLLVAADDRAARRAADRLAAADPNRVRVAAVTLLRPTVPDPTGDRLVVLVTTGTRTAWELVGITEACTEAGQEIAGVLLAQRILLTGGDAPHRPDHEPVLAGQS